MVLNSTGYTVSTGNVLYINTGYTTAGVNITMGGQNYYYAGSNINFVLPFVVPGGTTVSAVGGTMNMTGIEVTTTTVGVALAIGSTGYTVPANKTLYIYTGYATNGGSLNIGGTIYLGGGGTFSFSQPIVVPGGQTISYTSGTFNATGIER
jgi:hypothetical protein